MNIDWLYVYTVIGLVSRIQIKALVLLFNTSNEIYEKELIIELISDILKQSLSLIYIESDHSYIVDTLEKLGNELKHIKVLNNGIIYE